MKTIGITTTVPIEVLLAAGYRVIDLNNLFITSEDYWKYIEIAERDGFPKSSCAWIKGIYGAVLENKITEVIGVIEGDCSNTKALIEVLKQKGIKVYPFAYPHSHSLIDVKKTIKNFMDLFGVSETKVESIRKRLNDIRKIAKRIDELTYIEGKVNGFENHLYQVSLSDFNGDIDEFEEMLLKKLHEMEKRSPVKRKVRLGYIGVPPMTGDLYEFVEKFDSHIIYNEVQREFAFPRAEKAKDIYEQYYDYTYPYDINFRLEKIKEEIKKRKIDGIIHYTQAFCYRAIEDIIIKKELDIPVLNIEGDKLNHLDARTKFRIEAFLDMISDLKGC
ncbi:2-hydroxyacyl-CoA dehydratase family protein [Caloranaerobacter azorensis]|uniref:2-hydroxyacyl-CoA dehydratase n=1 Tax=Caloranaerobacter azorensis TaxID=116090 RepID=A0A6P1YCL4_9FIRM|nr:2-hydroxyacyl-CoA dehydratase [Caloranaerobacter azorensis]QIB25915.1 2-hydroxyacyl-CoA dehydratase [Caloranaerobacter azorensis]